MTTTTATTRLLSWVGTLDASDRAAFYEDLTSCVTAAKRTDDPGEIERCLRQWRLTAEGMTNAGLRDQLLE